MTDDSFDVEDEFLSVGRTFAEYSRMFDLDPRTLGNCSVIDCGGGAGSFTAVASALGAEATAIDPMYGPPPNALEPELEAAVDRNVSQLREKRDLYVMAEYGDVETRGRYLRAAYHRFLADYSRYPGRYVDGALPDLPVERDAADLALSANLLFLYDDRLDLDLVAVPLEDGNEKSRTADVAV